MPLTETPPVSGPMKPTFTLSLAAAALIASASANAARPAVADLPFLIIAVAPLVEIEFRVAAVTAALSGMFAQAGPQGKGASKAGLAAVFC